MSFLAATFLLRGCSPWRRGARPGRRDARGHVRQREGGPPGQSGVCREARARVAETRKASDTRTGVEVGRSSHQTDARALWLQPEASSIPRESAGLTESRLPRNLVCRMHRLANRNESTSGSESPGEGGPPKQLRGRAVPMPRARAAAANHALALEQGAPCRIRQRGREGGCLGGREGERERHRETERGKG